MLLLQLISSFLIKETHTNKYITYDDGLTLTYNLHEASNFNLLIGNNDLSFYFIDKKTKLNLTNINNSVYFANKRGNPIWSLMVDIKGRYQLVQGNNHLEYDVRNSRFIVKNGLNIKNGFLFYDEKGMPYPPRKSTMYLAPNINRVKISKFLNQ